MRRESRRGSQAIEFALIFPVFIALVFGGLDYSWYVLQRYTAMDVVAGGCRAGPLCHPGRISVCRHIREGGEFGAILWPGTVRRHDRRDRRIQPQHQAASKFD